MSTFKTRLPDGRTVEVIRDYVEYRTMGGPVRDPDWVGFDSNGHEHRAADLDATCRHIVEPDFMFDEGDGFVEEYPGDDWYECLTCGERITPGTKSEPPRVGRVLGSQSMYIDGEPVTSPEEADAVMTLLRS